MSALLGVPPDVLVVDDHPDTREALTELFLNEGLSAMAVGTAIEALAILQSGVRPGIILLDLEMPSLSGWGFCSNLVADPRLASIPIAIITATPAYRGVPHRPVDAGVFRKPLDLDALLATVRAELARGLAEKRKAEVRNDSATAEDPSKSLADAEIH